MLVQRALVTGLDGFTGRYMAQELESAGFEVWGLGMLPQDVPRYKALDLGSREALHDWVRQVRPSVVVHLAGVAFVGNGDAEAFYRVNLIGARNLLESVAEEAPSVRCVLLASSANVYGNTFGSADEGVLSEVISPFPANDYAVSKLAMEHMARLWFDKLPVVIARPFNYTGRGQSSKFLLPKVVEHFKVRAPEIELGNIEVSRDFSDVRAVAEAYRRIVQVCPSPQVVNVCSGKAHSLSDILAMATEISGHSISVKVNQSLVRSNEIRSLCGSADRLRSLIGNWQTPPLRETLAWMLSA